MSATAVLDELRALAVELAADGQDIVYRAPKGVMTPERVATLSTHKGEILPLLKVGAARALLVEIESRLEPMNARLLALFEAGDLSAAGRLQAEIRDVVDREWLPAVRRLGRALDRVGQLPIDDRSWVYDDVDQLARANGWQRAEDGGWSETPERAVRCIRCPEILASGDELFCSVHGAAAPAASEEENEAGDHDGIPHRDGGSATAAES